MNELHDVNDWITFGLYLGIKIGRLRAIEMECSTIQERRLKMLEEWQNNVTPTWSAVVQALLAIGMKRLASKLAQNHGEFNDNCNIDAHTLGLIIVYTTWYCFTSGIPTPQHLDDEPLQQLKDIPQYKEVRR